MSSTITLTGDWLFNIGNRRMTVGTGNLGTYATSGIAVTAAQVGLGVIQSMEIDPSGGYTFSYNASTGKILAYAASSGSFTAAGTNSAPTFTVSAGTIGSNMSLGLDVDTASAKVTGGTGVTTNRTLSTNTPVSAPTFTGSAVAVSVAEVTTSTNLSAITFNFRAYGL